MVFSDIQNFYDKLTILYPVYNPIKGCIEEHLNTWRQYGDYLKRIRFILIDDCSDKPLSIGDNLDLNLTVSRITTDIKYNIAGAKNLGFYIADEGWVLQSDIDHIIPPDVIKTIFSTNLKYGDVYRFSRTVIWNDGTVEKNFRPHQNSYLIERNTFWKIGGYDEDFSGHYGSEDTMMNYMMNKLGIKQHVIESPLILKRAYWTNMDRCANHNKKLLSAKKANVTYRNDKTLRFDWV